MEEHERKGGAAGVLMGGGVGGKGNAESMKVELEIGAERAIVLLGDIAGSL